MTDPIIRFKPPAKVARTPELERLYAAMRQAEEDVIEGRITQEEYLDAMAAYCFAMEEQRLRTN